MSEITIASTTDSQEQVEAALDADEATGYQETPSSDDSHTIVTSTTDEPIQVDEANRMYRGEPAARDGQFAQKPPEKKNVWSTTDSEEQIAAVQREIDEAKEARTEAHLGLTRRQREATISRLLAKNESLDKENEQLRSQVAARGQQQQSQPQPQPDAWQQATQRQYTPQEQQAAFENYRQAQVRIAEEEKSFVQRNPDYYESVRKLEPSGESPIPPNSYYHLMLHTTNPVDVGYHLSRNPQLVAKLWSLESSGRVVDAMTEINRIQGTFFR